MRFGNWASARHPGSASADCAVHAGPCRDAAIAGAIARFPGEQWGWWDLGSDLKARLRSVLDARFDELFAAGAEGFVPRYVAPGREILITWQPRTEDL